MSAVEEGSRACGAGEESRAHSRAAGAQECAPTRDVHARSKQSGHLNEWIRDVDQPETPSASSEDADSPVGARSHASAERDGARDHKPREARAQSRPKPAASKQFSAAQRRKRAAAIHRWARYAVQIAFLILAPGVFSGAFNGVKYLFTQIGAIEGFEATSFVVLLVMVLAFTILFGRFFCGYACAFGTLGDLLFHVFEFLRSKTPVPRVRFPEPLVRVLSLLKYAVLAGICAACVLGVWGQVSGYSPWVAFAGFTSLSLDDIKTGAFVALGLVAVGMIVRERFFCQFLCPLGAVFSLMPVLGFSEFTRTRAHCAKGCGRCRAECPASIWPDADTLLHGECVSCGRCADTCPMSNVNLVAVERQLAKEERLAAEAERVDAAARKAAQKAEAAGEGPDAVQAAADAAREKASAPKPLRKTREGWRLLRGTETGVVLAKAALLLLLCWVCGATRYFPPFAEVVGPLPFG